MGFWKTIGSIANKVGTFALEEAKAGMERNKEYQAEMPTKGEDDLFNIVKEERKRSPLRASAAFNELKNRGYSPEQINFLTSD